MADLAALHDTFACCTAAVLQAWRGNRDPALLSLREAHVAAEEAFGPGSSEVAALGVVFAAIRQAAEGPLPGATRSAAVLRTPQRASTPIQQ